MVPAGTLGAMFVWLLLAFTVVPLVELSLLIRIGRAIGGWPTIGLVVLTGVLGAALAKHEGLRTWQGIQLELAQGRMPAHEMVNGIMILVAGLLLVTPGIITDAVGFALLVPPIRNLLRTRLTEHFKQRMVIMTPGPDAPGRADDGFIDVEAQAVSREE